MKIPQGYFAILFKEHESHTIGVRFLEHPNVITFGRTWGEAEQMAQEALASALESEFERGMKLPKAKRPKVKRGERMVFIQIPSNIRMAYLLRDWREEAGLTQKQIAHKLEISYQAYQRMERPGRSNLTILTLEKIARALKRKLVLDLQDQSDDEELAA